MKPRNTNKKKREPVKVTLRAVVFKGAPPYTALLVDRVVDAAVCGTLKKMGWLQQDYCDGLQEVRMRAIRAFKRGMKPPATAAEMGMLCARIARNYVFDLWRKRAVARQGGDAGLCEDPDEYSPLTMHLEERDPVDAGRQLEVAAGLFRERKMPDHGVDILEGVASECSYQEIAQDLKITDRAVEGRLKTMRRLFEVQITARRMVE